MQFGAAGFGGEENFLAGVDRCRACNPLLHRSELALQPLNVLLGQSGLPEGIDCLLDTVLQIDKLFLGSLFLAVQDHGGVDCVDAEVAGAVVDGCGRRFLSSFLIHLC